MSSPFIPDKKYKHSVTKITPRDKVVVVFHCNQDHLVEGDLNDPTNFLVVKKAVVKERIPLNEYIQQFDREVELKEKIARIQTKEEYNEFIAQTALAADGKTYVQQDYFSDLQMEEIIQRGEAAFAALDPELKKDLSKEEFLASFNQKTMDNFIAEKIAADAAKHKQKEGGAE